MPNQEEFLQSQMDEMANRLLRPSLLTESEWSIIYDDLGLPPQMRRVLSCVMRGASDKQTADILGLAVPTVRSHMQRLFVKLGVSDRTELILRVVSVILEKR